MVVISHSTSQIIDAKMIYVLKEGWLVERGTNDELDENNGTYRQNFNASARSLNPVTDGGGGPYVRCLRSKRASSILRLRD